MHPPTSSSWAVHGARPSLAGRRRASVRFASAPVMVCALPDLSLVEPHSGRAPRTAAWLSFDDWMGGEGLLEI
ncbi:hypothetical protein V3N99_04650 [Dermatophilaceae bacterium Soc4.6]